MKENRYNIRRLSRDEWSCLAPGFLDYNYRQLWGFGKEAADRIGAISEYVAICDSSRTIGLANVRIKKLPFFPVGIAYITGGPLVRNNEQQPKDSLEKCLEVLKMEYVRKHHCILRIINPLGEKNWMTDQVEVFENGGYVIADNAKHYRTIVVDLDRSQEALRKGLAASTWRRHLNRSEKNELVILRSTDDDIFSKVEYLFNELRDRKLFDVDLEPAFYQKVQKNLDDRDKFVIHIAESKGKPVAAHVGSFLGDTAVYLLGASSKDGRDLKASYLLHWKVMLYAKEKGCRWYDLGGIDPDINPGVFHFKKRMGGVELTAVGPYEVLPGRLTGRIIRFAENVYRNIRK